MCFDPKKSVSEIKIAQRNIPVFKSFLRLSHDLVSPFMSTSFSTTISRRCRGDLYARGKAGYYSYKTRNGAKNGLGSVVMELYIPKGTKYREGYNDGCKAYRSEYLKEE